MKEDLSTQTGDLEWLGSLKVTGNVIIRQHAMQLPIQVSYAIYAFILYRFET